jgi:hypothetical protein
LRGRYNAAQGLSWGLSSALAPAIIAGLFGSGLSNWWPLSVGAFSFTGGAFMLLLRRRLTPSQDGRTR